MMLVANMWPEAGLCNGVMGTVVDIIYRSAGDACAGILPIAVVCNFTDYSGPAFFT